MNPIVITRSGQVRGSMVDGTNAFKGIPYAAPPFGANRLRPPQGVAPWSGVRDAFAFSPKSPQPPYPPPIDTLIPEFTGPGEECSTLNVWSPELTGRHPVMVWIPGGMFEFHATGACPWYDGSRFARDGIVCVTINYRVGAEGFLYLGDGQANRGLLDQIAALEWVRDNIAAFGGDPGNVTVFGESAGAMSIGSLLAMPRATRLFRRAILQSGAAHPMISVASARRICEHLAAKLGVAVTRDAIAAVPIDRTLQAQLELHAELDANPDPRRWGDDVASSQMLWGPVVDGDVIPAPAMERIAAGAGSDVDIIVGTNVDEHRLFLGSMAAFGQIGVDRLTRTLAAYGLPLEPALAVYRAAHPGANSGDLLAAIQTDWYWRMPAIRLAEAHARGRAATYMYELAWRTPQFGGVLGACHALDVAFVWDIIGQGTEPLWGADPPQQLADRMHAAWVAFATSGDCGWPQYDLTRRSTMRFDLVSSVVDDPRAEERALWAAARELQPAH
jgi:para-nitrobenzyl esterase